MDRSGRLARRRGTREPIAQSCDVGRSLRLARRYRSCLLIALALSQLGCSFLFFGGRFSVEVSPLPQNLNGKFPVAVDVVVVYDKGLEKQLADMKAVDWFDQREQILRDNPGKAVSSNLHEWVPGQVVQPLRVSYKIGARSAFIFVNYFSPGDHRQQIRVGQNVLLRLGETDFEVSKR